MCVQVFRANVSRQAHMHILPVYFVCESVCVCVCLRAGELCACSLDLYRTRERGGREGGVE